MATMVKVIVNGRPFSLEHGRRISYLGAVKLAFNGKADDTLPETLTVTFRYKKGRVGTMLLNGPSIPAAEGLVINVSTTGSA